MISIEYYAGILLGSRIYFSEEEDELGAFNVTTIAIYVPFIVIFIMYTSDHDVLYS